MQAELEARMEEVMGGGGGAAFFGSGQGADFKDKPGGS